MDATVGFININQNKIIKIFSVASVALLPPTLIASLYGMNFQHMPELAQTLGLPLCAGADGGQRRGAHVVLPQTRLAEIVATCAKKRAKSTWAASSARSDTVRTAAKGTP
jgi:hypothetical protein